MASNSAALWASQRCARQLSRHPLSRTKAVKIKLHDGRTISNPTEADIERLFMGLSDAGDFIILSDGRGSEVRAAGPQNGNFLLQCDLPKDGRVFRGERLKVGLAEATGIFREFLAGHAQWSSEFTSREGLPSRVAAVLIGLGLAAASLLLWWFRRAA